MTINEIRQGDSFYPANSQSQPPQLVMGKGQIRQAYDEFAPHYRRYTWIENNLLGVNRLRRRLMAKASGAILDVACGTGENFPYLPAESQITAVDLSPGMVAQAQRRARELGRSIQLSVMDAAVLDFPGNSFDTVVSALSTCTFPDPIAALKEMERVCKPGGRILLLEHGRSRVGWVGRYQDRRAHRHFQAAGCRWNQEPDEIVKAAGLEILAADRSFFGVFHTMEIAPIK
jgi:ubiquinone/menaquinone biosynthesis C-methylase UbiE